jgi:hypothetical protein
MIRYALLALAVAAGLADHVRADEILSDGIAAQVGNDIVLISEVMQHVGSLEARMRKADMPDIEIAKLRAAGLEKLIEAPKRASSPRGSPTINTAISSRPKSSAAR